jgi:hypothetical protein
MASFATQVTSQKSVLNLTVESGRSRLLIRFSSIVTLVPYGIAEINRSRHRAIPMLYK